MATLNSSAKSTGIRGRWKLLGSKIIFDHPRIKIIEDRLELPNAEVISYLRFASGNNGVTVICIKENKILLQEEYSYPVDENLIQFPGGKINKNEEPYNAARRELIEESGYTFASAKNLGWYYVNNRRTNSKMYVVLAQNIKKVKKQGGDLEEEIKSFWLPINEFKQMISNGLITNYSVLAAWVLYTHQNNVPCFC